MKCHILKKAVVLDTPQVRAASVDKAGTPVSCREIIRAKASDEGHSLSPSQIFIVLQHSPVAKARDANNGGLGLRKIHHRKVRKAGAL